MVKSYIYKAFGLVIESEFELPELIVSDEQPDVIIRYGDVPERLQTESYYGGRFYVNDNELLLQVRNIACFYVRNGKEIIVQRINKTGLQEMRLFLYGSCIGAILQQRGIIPIHGSSIYKDGHGIVIAGLSGTGKSSVTASLVLKGYQYISDDISAVNFIDDVPHLLPGIPRIKLWEDTCNMLNIPVDDATKIRTGLDKYGFSKSELFATNPVELKKIIIISTHLEPNFRINKINGLKKYHLLKNNIYRPVYLRGFSEMNMIFEKIIKCSSNIEVVSIVRPNKCKTQELTKKIRHYLNAE